MIGIADLKMKISLRFYVYVYIHAHTINTSWTGRRASNTHLGRFMPAFSLVYINRLAGKTAISNAIIPHAAKGYSAGIHNAIPSTTSAAPLSLFSSGGLGYDGGIILA